MPTIVPVELSAFSANVNNGNVVLNWTTETELNNQGFEIERRTAEGQFIAIGHVQGNGTTTERKAIFIHRCILLRQENTPTD